MELLRFLLHHIHHFLQRPVLQHPHCHVNILHLHLRNEFFSLKSNTCVNHGLHSIGKLAGIEKHFTFHTARHTNATLLIYRGANITTVQKLLGHRSVTTTEIYSEIMGKTIVRDLMKSIV